MEMNTKDVQKFWETRGKVTGGSKTYFTDKLEAEKRLNTELKAIERRVELEKKDILDIGCGTGEKTFYFRKKANFVVGIDYTDSLLDIAKERMKSDKNVEFICAGSVEFDCGRTFDVAIVSALFIYLNDVSVVETVRNISKHLKKGGIAVIKESIGVSGRFEVINTYSEELKTVYNGIYRSGEEIVDLFECNGFKLLSEDMLYQHRKETVVWLFVFEAVK